MTCRFCSTKLEKVFIDLFNSPPSNSFLSKTELDEPEIFYPLTVYTCHQCFLVQIGEYKKSEAIFNDEYVYFSSYSTSWLDHAKRYTEKMIKRFGYDQNSLVVEIASNDGYLLQYFQERDVPVLGIEPTSNTASVAIEKGITTITRFFGTELARELVAEGTKADLLIGNNVLAHVPDIVDFVRGMSILLHQDGVITMEFPHIVQLIEQNQFDTIYHEHFSYLSFFAVRNIFQKFGLTLFDVEELPTHGGSLRIYARHHANSSLPVSKAVDGLLQSEIQKGIAGLDYYAGFQAKALNVITD